MVIGDMKKDYHIEINISAQCLRLYHGNQVVKEYPISTARHGPGERMDSECTPRGEHVIAEKIGGDCPVNTVFVSRRPTGEIYTPKLGKQFPERDWILTRILWLQGSEPGKNLGGNVDSHERFIYIHGAPDDVEVGSPGSRGCIRMRNDDVIEVYNAVEIGARVSLHE